MRMKSIELMVGVFILVSIVALMILAFRVSGLTLGQPGNTYKLYARFDNVGGLTDRAKVTVAGVVVGRVNSITLDKDYYQGLVEMDIYQESDNLTLDTSAVILTAGLLGEKYVGLVVGADEDYLGDGDFIEDTQSALVLEELIGKFLFNRVSE